MKRLTEKQSRHSLTTQIVVWVVGFVSILFVTALFIMFHYARQSIYQEAMEKARQTLRTTELRIDADDDHVRFTVEDTGPGIPSDKADFIFEKFTKINMFTEGLGLGLFLCRRVVELLGGHLTLDPQYTKGSRFVLELPLK